jgi:hypothetical protein
MQSTGLYTFILEYRGGTYISQTNATTLVDAIRGWIAVHTEDSLATWDLSRHKLEFFIEENPTVALADTTGVWCVTGTIDDHFALLNIVDTCPV